MNFNLTEKIFIKYDTKKGAYQKRSCKAYTECGARSIAYSLDTTIIHKRKCMQTTENVKKMVI